LFEISKINAAGTNCVIGKLKTPVPGIPPLLYSPSTSKKPEIPPNELKNNPNNIIEK
jgi:hypothetical protein